MQDYQITDQMRAWGRAHGYNVDEYVDSFNDYLANRTKRPYKDLDAAFRNCVRQDWPRVRKQHGYVPPRTFTVPAQYLSSDGKSRWVPATKDSEGYWEKRNEL